MRLDLYLKASRLIKRRATAREFCDSGNVQVNGREAKASREIRQGDIITLQFSSRIIELEVTSVLVPNRRTSREEMFRVRRESRTARNEDRWNENL